MAAWTTLSLSPSLRNCCSSFLSPLLVWEVKHRNEENCSLASTSAFSEGPITKYVPLWPGQFWVVRNLHMGLAQNRGTMGTPKSHGFSVGFAIKNSRTRPASLESEQCGMKAPLFFHVQKDLEQSETLVELLQAIHTHLIWHGCITDPSPWWPYDPVCAHGACRASSSSCFLFNSTPYMAKL